MSPAGASDGGRSFASGNSFEGRNRSGSVQSHKTLLQVTMDNEQFILVDVTGMTSADGIKERVFAKVRIHNRRSFTCAPNGTLADKTDAITG